MVGRITWPSLWSAVAIGLLVCAILVANNLRDIRGNIDAGKRTLATQLGEPGTRWFFLGLLIATAIAQLRIGASQ